MAKSKNKKVQNNQDPVAKRVEKVTKELQDVKKLLVLQLIASGVKSTEIAEALGLDVSNFRKVYHAGKLIKRMKKSTDQSDAQALKSLAKLVAKVNAKK